MPAKKQAKVLVTCPRCGHQQPEARAAISTACKECGQYIRVQEVLKPAVKAAARPREVRKLACFECGTDLEVAASAQSTMCKRCSAHIDLRDYRISNAVSKNFKTKGEFVIEPKGYVFNTEAVVGDAIIRGKFLGKLVAERSLTIYSTADIKGIFKTGRLIIPAENHFRWKEELAVGGAEIAGELAANLRAAGAVVLRAAGRLFGNVEAGDLVVEEGAVMVGQAKIGVPKPLAPEVSNPAKKSPPKRSGG
ncbi:MAG TPA: polymer-forming cytoskeletal protein [Candidatus Angelobacter sp.]|nr:polymer-forming cytoskeletal protein [Candidatus Angelobacter sp.]